ncbi:hypothetical protein EWI17_12570 [Enterococcus faecium]|nr:hypothetical protein B6S05_06685 [Enterococcus faecium]AWV62809.1 hypothetical protein B6S06_06690 [Enterococcus faecium]OLY99383.1 hypothetical protein BSQ81_13115 [Enterococcus faecium]OLZ00349.1 hypothetical protein BSQ84_13285 [Enterococcus faecium]OLZ03772.1 hypothetical protein BSQ83_13020 [Enterococcus faecium]
MEVVTEVVSSKIFRIIFRKSYFWNTVYQEVVSLPFSSESQGTISKNSFSCLMNIVTCDSELAGEHRLFGLFVNKD